MLKMPIRDLNNYLLKPKDKGGFLFAREKNGSVIISDTTIRNLLPYYLGDIRNR